jgi:Tfp pilus assembly protein PilO
MSNRYWIFGTAVIVIAVAALGWFLGIQPALQQAAATDAARADVEAQNAQYELQLAQLREDYENIDALRAEVETLRLAIPNHADYEGFIAEINGLAAGTATTVTNVVIGDASWYMAAPTSATPPAEVVEEAPADGTAAGAGDTAAAAAEGEQVIPLPNADGSVNGSNFIAIPVQLTVTGEYLQFIRALQADQRLFLVTGFSAADGTPPTINGLLYVLLGDDVPTEVVE